MSEPTTEKSTATVNPYIALLDEMIHRRRKRLPERIVQFKFCRFCARVWENRARVFNIPFDPDELKPYDSDSCIGGPVVMAEFQVWTDHQKLHYTLEENVERWIQVLQRYSLDFAKDVLRINCDYEILFSCLGEVKADIGGGDKIAYVPMELVNKIEPLSERWRNLKRTDIISLRACDFLSLAICDFFEVPSDAFRILTPNFATRLRGTVLSNPEMDALFFCRFNFKKEIQKLKRVMGQGAFYKLNDLSVVTRIVSTAYTEPERIFESLKRLKAYENTDFLKYLDEFSGKNGVFAPENPTLDDYLI